MTATTTRGPEPIVVLGGSIAGLGTALFLARHGFAVTVIDRDPSTGSAADVGADTTPRRATAQAAHSHIYVARLRHLLADRAPDVLAHLLDRGVAEVRLRDGLPPTLADRNHPALDDPDLVALAARRSVLEHALRSAVLRERGVSVVAGVAATGVHVDRPLDGGPARVRAVRLEDRRLLPAGLVVDAGGRRTPLPGWLTAQGVGPQLLVSECGISYLTRFYRLRDQADALPLNRGFNAGGSFDGWSCLVFPADRGAFSVTFGVLPEDRGLRGLTDPAAFDAAVAAIPMLAPWVDPDRSEPISDVACMTGLKNRIRRYVTDGRPVALGVAAVGDAAATSNPAHSRGCTLALVHAAATADAVEAHGADLGGLALALDGIVDAELRPWVEDSIEQDAVRLSKWRPGSPGVAERRGRLTNGALYGAAQVDPECWRSFSRLQQLLAKPDEVLADPEVMARVDAVSPVRLPPVAAPSHDDLAELVNAAAGSVRRRGALAR